MDLAREGTLRRYIQDLLSRISAIAMLVISALVFIGAGIGGIAMIGRLGGAGWLIYIVVMSTFALVFGPIVASSYTLRKEGSRKYREERRRRIEEQRRKFGLHLRAQEDDRREE